MNLRDRILNREYDYLPNPLGLFDPLVQIRAEILEPIRRKLLNESPRISRLSFSEDHCHKHNNFFVSKILKALSKSRLNDYQLYCGKAFYIRYTGRNLCFEEEFSKEVYELRNKKEGFSLQFRIIEETDLGPPALHVLFLIRETDRQGSFFAIKRMLVDELWEKVFEPAGFAYLFGRAVWSANSEIRHAGPRSKDWREVLCYVGLDEDLQPILISGLRLFYYRLGFLQMRLFSNEYGPEYVALFSTNAEKIIKDSIGEYSWSEIRRFNVCEARKWREIFAERESILGHDELQRRIEAKRSKMTAQLLN